MNIFFFITDAQGKRELLTAPLDGTILAGGDARLDTGADEGVEGVRGE